MSNAAKALAAAQTNWAGGQGYDFFNVWLAPYIRGLPYERVKQLAQMFVYEMSQMYVARGGQTVFSSIALECSVPRIAQDIPAVLPGGKVGPDVYGDYADEATLLFNAAGRPVDMAAHLSPSTHHTSRSISAF